MKVRALKSVCALLVAVVLMSCSGRGVGRSSGAVLDLSRAGDRESRLRLALPLLLGQTRTDGVTYGDYVRRRIAEMCGDIKNRRFTYDLRIVKETTNQILLLPDEVARCPQLGGFYVIGEVTNSGEPSSSSNPSPMSRWFDQFEASDPL